MGALVCCLTHEMSTVLIFSVSSTLIVVSHDLPSSTGDYKLTVPDSDDRYEYRHVILPKQMLKLIPKS